MAPATAALLVLLTAVIGGASASGMGRAAPSSPIKHVVVVFEENHSFDNVFGRYCVKSGRCEGATEGRLHDGGVIPLPHAKDIVASAAHNSGAIIRAIDGGKMDGFDTFRNCKEAGGYPCMGQYDPKDVPNLTALARSFALSDATFETTPAGSWVSHLQLVASGADGFTGSNPVNSTTGAHRQAGWGCDAFTDASWVASSGSRPIFVPSCVPSQTGAGPYRPSPVRWAPTIMDRLDQAGVSWKLYAGGGPKKKRFTAGYLWEICPTFAECLLGPQSANWVPSDDILKDAAKGRLPNVSIVTPTPRVSQHNSDSMLVGDTWLGQLASAIMNGPEWSSTALFITYDDCGCFYDHVPPPPGAGVRVPMVMVSPYARAGFTDSRTATFDSILGYIERTFGVSPLGRGDARAYAFGKAFDYTQQPLPPVHMVVSRIPLWEQQYLLAHPGDPDDPS
jgi:phospholipase C